MKESDIKPIILPIYYLLCVYCRSTGGTWCGCSKPASSTSRTLTCATRPSRGGDTLYIHYTISTELYLPYLQHYIRIYTISTALYTPYLLHYIYHIISRLAPLTFTQFVLPFLLLAGGLASAAAAFLCEITRWRNKVQHQGKIRKMTRAWKDY